MLSELKKQYNTLYGIVRMAQTDFTEPGTVLQELQAGYMIKDRLLRPAMVKVAKA